MEIYKNRLSLIAKEIDALIDKLDENRLMEALANPKFTSSALVHIINIEEACKITTEE